MTMPTEGPYIKGSSTDPAVNPNWRAAQDFQINRKALPMTDTDLSPEQQVRLRIAEAYIASTAHNPVTPEGQQVWINKMTDVVIHGMVLNRVYP